MGPDYSRAGLARFIEFVVEKGLVHPATAQGWRVSTSKVLEELSPEQAEDVRRIQVIPACSGNVTEPAPVALKLIDVLKPLEKVSVPVPRKAKVPFAFWMVTLLTSTGKGKWTS